MIAGRNTPIQEAIREQVAGAARWLWLKQGKRAQYELMHSFGAHIVYLQGVSFLGERRMSPADFTYMCRVRARIADAGLYMALECGISCNYLRDLHARAVIPKAMEQGMPRHGQRRDTAALAREATADAAQWLWANRAAVTEPMLARYAEDDAVALMNIARTARQWDERCAATGRKYSLSDLQAAYAVGHYDGCNAPNAHINEAKRDAALKEI